jgi:hypothetical protein
MIRSVPIVIGTAASDHEAVQHSRAICSTASHNVVTVVVSIVGFADITTEDALT